MLRKQNGSRAIKSWDKARHLHTYPLKPIDNLAYQEQVASCMSIISPAYLQQGLVTLMGSLKEKKPNVDRAVQTVRDLYDFSAKVLDQCGRSGAFHHLIRRKAAAADTGLDDVREVQARVMPLPLSASGVFGKGLDEQLKCIKEQKDQLNDWVPEIEKKRKFSGNNYEKAAKRQKPSYSSKPAAPSSTVTNAQSKSSYRHNSEYRRPAATEMSSKPAVPSFRIPKKK